MLSIADLGAFALCPVHIITNDYLAERDALESLPFAQALNIKVTASVRANRTQEWQPFLR